MKEISNEKTGGNGLCSQSVSGIYDNESCVIMRLNLFFFVFCFFFVFQRTLVYSRL